MLINPYAFASAALWTPANITTTLWLDAADSSTITTVSGAVSQWNDKSGSAFNFSQATSANRPLYGSRQLNGKKVVDFNGSSHFLTRNTTTTSAGNWSVFMATDSDYVSASIRYYIDIATGRLILADATDSTNGSRGPAFFDSTWKGPQQAMAGGQIVGWILESPSSAVIYRNDTAIASALSYAQRALNGTNAIGRHNNTSTGHYDGAIGEIIIIPGVVSASTRQIVNGYLAHKWGLAANLPADHPYKSAAPTV